MKGSFNSQKIYQRNGYVDVRYIAATYKMPFTFIIGGRGTGKTYNTLDYSMQDHLKFVFMRRTKEAFQDAVAMNPVDAIGAVRGDFYYTCHTLPGTKSIYGWYPAELVSGELKDSGDAFGIGSSLVKIGKTRGLDAHECKVIVMDEFIKAPYEPAIASEAGAFFNAYETVNRNRELTGEPPVQAFLLSNSDDITNDYFITLRLVDSVDKMKAVGHNVFLDTARGICVVSLDDSPISKEKAAHTALYAATAGTSYYDMAVGNSFTGNVFSRTKSMPLIEYRLLVSVGELCIYQHKSADMYYACLHKSGTCKAYGTDDTSIARFCKAYYYLWEAYMGEQILFETHTSEALFQKYWK